MENQRSQYYLSSSSFQGHLQPQQPEQQIIELFWSRRRQEIKDASDIKNHPLPLARIKKIMKSDEEVHMVSSDAPILFAKACELFILELTVRGWHQTEENKSRMLQKSDITAAVAGSDMFDFLVDILPREVARAKGAATAVAAPCTGSGSSYYSGVAPRVPYFYCPTMQMRPGMMMIPSQINPPPMFPQPEPEFGSQIHNYLHPSEEYEGSITSDAAPATTSVSEKEKNIYTL